MNASLHLKWCGSVSGSPSLTHSIRQRRRDTTGTLVTAVYGKSLKRMASPRELLLGP